jgi:hypothetical protein
VTVSVCTNNDIITDYGVFPECNSQVCVGAPKQTMAPDKCEDGEAKEFTWMAEDGEQYYVHVRSDVTSGVGTNFTIVYMEADDGRDGDGASGGSGASVVVLSSLLILGASAAATVFL